MFQGDFEYYENHETFVNGAGFENSFVRALLGNTYDSL